MSAQTFELEGIRFDYPADWEFEGSEEEGVRTLSVADPDGLAFVIITIDPARPDPADIAAAALEAMRDEYPDLDSFPVVETINDHESIGHDIEFMTLDISNSAFIRCHRTPSRTILTLGQWSDLGPDSLSDIVHGVLHSIEETD